MSSPSAALFAATVFASAFLIFFVQPMMGKQILPWFGGAPSVWMLCLAFYQLTLFLGYAYAHLLNERIRSDRQLIVHAILFAGALFVLPVLPAESWAPRDAASPSLRILSMLSANLGLPFLLLASTGPLIQVWFARAFPGKSPYPLYAVSNVGSLLALLAYPFAVEPRFALPAQSRTWSWAFAACGVAVLVCGWQALRAARSNSIVQVRAKGEAAPAETVDAGTWGSKLGVFNTLLWILLPACAVVLFMGVTNELCLDVASIPFLWIVPLAIYLITFIACFGSKRFYRRGAFAVLALLSAGLLIWLRVGNQQMLNLNVMAAPLVVIGSLYLLVLFFGCMLLHGELYRLRPNPDRLTAYYLCVSGGGALGGLFVAIAAPQLFSDYYELPFGLLACMILSTLACLKNPGPRLQKPAARKTLAAVVGLASVVLSVLAARVSDAVYGVPTNDGTEARLLERTRNFFSILRVMAVSPEDPDLHRVVLKHGTTSHGSQFQRPDLRRVPVSYFGNYTGVGLVMHRRSESPMHVGIIGLGAGTLAAYGRDGDRFQFYEIDPDVIAIAGNDAYFSYLADSRAAIRVVTGDARLSLRRQWSEAGSQQFDLFIVDAFSSDSIPVHLITLEAMQLYVQHLKPNGVLAVHISNVNLELSPLVFRIATELGMRPVRIVNMAFPRRRQASAEWMILSMDAAYIDSFPPIAEQTRAALRAKPQALTLTYPEEVDLTRAPLWTDDYSDLLSVLKIPGWTRQSTSTEPAKREGS